MAGGDRTRFMTEPQKREGGIRFVQLQPYSNRLLTQRAFRLRGEQAKAPGVITAGFRSRADTGTA
jgi:hypothetical protein